MRFKYLVFEGRLCQYLVCKHVLLQVVDLHELHAALRADIRPNVLVLHQMVLELATVGEGLMAFGALKGGRALVADLVALEVCVSGELHAALRADVTVAALVFSLMSTQLTGVGKASDRKSVV